MDVRTGVLPGQRARDLIHAFAFGFVTEIEVAAEWIRYGYTALADPITGRVIWTVR